MIAAPSELLRERFFASSSTQERSFILDVMVALMAERSSRRVAEQFKTGGVINEHCGI